MKIGITGHQQMPESARRFAEVELEQILSSIPDLEGVSSLAAGADQLFADIVLGLGGQLIAVLPSAGYIDTFDTPGAEHFTYLLEQSSEVVVLDFPSPSEEAFFAAGKEMVDSVDAVCAVWDGEVARGLGGSADVVQYARDQGKEVHVLWPSGVSR